MRFADIPGLLDVKKRLVEAVHKQQIAHSLLFDGKQGSAALPLAMAFATFVNCESPSNDDSCGTCSSCSKYDKLMHPDLSFAFPTAGGKKVLSENFITQWREFVINTPFGSYADWLNAIQIKQGNIPVEEARQVIQKLSLKAYEGGYKVVLIWQVEAMAAPAANALLKILEEPPEDTLFLLVTSDYNRLLPTIVSRVQRIAVRELETQELVHFLREERGLSAERAAKIAFLTEGNLNSALHLLHQTPADHKEWFVSWMRYCFAFDLSKLVPLADSFDEFSKEEQKQILDYGLRIFREIYLEHIGLGDQIKLEGPELDFVKKFSRVFRFDNIDRLTQAMSEAIHHIERNVRAKMVFLDLSLTLSGLIK